MMRRERRSRLALGALILLLGLASVYADDNATAQEEVPPPKKRDVVNEDFNVANEDWGSYYDPQNVFCGKFDCYKILGFDYESFGNVKPDTKMITKRYRALSREWHPDKSKHKNAKSRFVKIARAYEVLTDKTVREEYDMMRYDQEKYFQKYGSSVLWSYAPKSDTAVVLIVLFILGNVASWFIQKHRWQMVADRLIKAAVEDWSPRDGGTTQSKQLRERALELLQAEQEKENGDNTTEQEGSLSPSKAGKKAVKGKPKLSLKEKKQKEQEASLPIITDLVNQMQDFGGGFHKPTWRDLMAVGLVRLPFRIMSGGFWQVKYLVRRLLKKELSDEEREVLTQHAVGPITWDISTESERDDMVKRELWVKDNLIEWMEEQEIKNLSAAEQKHYYKLKKKGKLDKLE
jgi:DnaJ homolog subfamily C member 25